MKIAEARRMGEVAGSQHAVSWLLRNEPNRDELESAIVANSDWENSARMNSEKVGYGGGKTLERNRKAFETGYVQAAKKELMRAMGRLP
jgi:hypothetical protein